MKPELTGPWASHLPALLACVLSTEGPVLELGVGHFSTPILHAVCEVLRRTLVSVEKDPQWAAQFQNLASPLHALVVGDYDDILSRRADQLWSVALIDEAVDRPARRSWSFLGLIHRASFVIVHDYWRENREFIDPLLVGVPHYVVCTNYEPPTLVASMVRNIPDVLLP